MSDRKQTVVDRYCPLCDEGLPIMSNLSQAHRRKNSVHMAGWCRKRIDEETYNRLFSDERRPAPPSPSQPVAGEPRILTAADIERIGAEATKDQTCKKCGTGGPIMYCGGSRNGCGCACHHSLVPERL